MITSRRIERTLTFLDNAYNSNLVNKDQEIPILYAKMAILEYSGWLELSFDEIARNCVRRKLRTVAAREILEQRIKKTHGFTYNNNVRPLLAIALGTIKLQNIERKMNKNGDLDALRTNLGNINLMRNEAAHTFTSGRTSRFDAPSAIIADFKRTEPILQKYWKIVCDET